MQNVVKDAKGNELAKGMRVVNFGMLAIIERVLDGGQAMVVRQVGRKNRWLADPAKCVKDTRTVPQASSPLSVAR